MEIQDSEESVKPRSSTRKAAIPSQAWKTALKAVEWAMTKESEEIQGERSSRSRERLWRGDTPKK
jgi:hypothetical protein